jgi:multiple sugar transport system permease protein
MRLAKRMLLFCDKHLVVVFIIPAGLCLLLLVGYPVVLTIVNSFTNYSLMTANAPQFVGLDNYARVLAGSEFWISLRNGAVFTAASLALQLVIGYIGAKCLYRISRGSALLRVLLIVPWTFPSIAMAFAWRWMLDPLFGVVNSALMGLGIIDQPIAWFGGKATSMLAVIAMNTWFAVPFMMLAIFAGLMTIPKEHYEVFALDGHGLWNKLRYVEIPSLRRIVGVLVILRTIWTFNNFDFIYLTTGGGPALATQNVPVYVYRTAWGELLMGKASAINVLLLIVLGALALVYFKVFDIEGDE